MDKKNIAFLSIIILIVLSGCSKNSINNETTVEESSPIFETTTLNNLPDNEYPDDKLIFKPVELILDKSIEFYTEYYDDGTKSDIYESDDYVEEVNYNEKGILRDYSKTVYDDKGRIDCIYVFDAEKEFKYACLREYDSLGRYYRYYYYNSECKLVCYEVVSYDEYGNDKSVMLYDTEGNSIDDFPDVFD